MSPAKKGVGWMSRARKGVGVDVISKEGGRGGCHQQEIG